jgi:hypothetical protein
MIDCICGVYAELLTETTAKQAIKVNVGALSSERQSVQRLFGDAYTESRCRIRLA